MSTEHTGTSGQGEPRKVTHPSCRSAADPVRHLDELERGPLIAVPRARPKPQSRPQKGTY